MEEGLLTLIGLMLLAALFLALVGVPVLWSRTRQMQLTLERLQQQVQNIHDEGASEHRSVTRSEGKMPNSERPHENEPIELKAAKVPKDASEPVVSASAASRESMSAASVAHPEADEISSQDPTENADPWANYTAEKSALSYESQQGSYSENSPFQALLNRVGQVNLTARVGSVVLIFGAIFLGKYASDIGVLTLQAKLAMMALASLALIAAGIWFAERLQQYGEILQATGFAGWLITLFTAHVLFEQIGWVSTLLAGAASVVFIGYRALKQDSQMLAIIAYLGGFLTPFIASSEASSLWRLFAYMALLNAAVVLTALTKPWRWLVREAYAGSFILLAGLMLAEYLQRDLDEWVIQLPMLTFTGTIVASFSLLAWRWLQTNELQFKRHLSGVLFGVPSAAVLAVTALLHEQSATVAVSLCVMAIWYAGLAVLARSRLFAAVAIVVGSMAVPFALNDSLTSIVYSLEGAAFVVWSVKHWRLSGLIWGVLLQVAAAIFAFHLFTDIEIRSDQLWLSWWLYGAVFGAGLVSALFIRSQPDLKALGAWPERLFLIWTLAIWLYQWSFWLAQTFNREETFWYLLWMTVATMMLVLLIAWRNWWPRFAEAQLPLSLFYIGAVTLYMADYGKWAETLPLLSVAGLSLLVWTMLILHGRFFERLPSWIAVVGWFALPMWGAVALYHAPEYMTDWNLVWALLWPLVIVVFLSRLLRNLLPPSPVRRNVRMISLLLFMPLITATLSALGNYAPLPYWPLVHPLSLIIGVSAWALYRHVRHRSGFRSAWVVWLGFAVTVELNRWLFHYAGVAFELDAWLDSALTQTVWTLVWAIIGSALMVSGARLRHSRTLWLTGAVALGIVVLKMFLLDLSQVDTLYRILSFIGVGALLLAVGNFAPMPPKSDHPEAPAAQV